jgi:hypothetical protein
MFMKNAMLAALHEELAAWDAFLAALTEEQCTSPVATAELSIKDELAHLWAWQQRSVARMQAAVQDSTPLMPDWPMQLTQESAGVADQINAWIYESNRDLAWDVVHSRWRAGYLQMLGYAEQIEERFLLDSDRYPWMEGYSLAVVLVSSYDHHHEHLEKLRFRMA